MDDRAEHTPGFLEPRFDARDVTPVHVGPITVRPVDIADAEQFPEIAAALEHARKLRDNAFAQQGRGS